MARGSVVKEQAFEKLKVLSLVIAVRFPLLVSEGVGPCVLRNFLPVDDIGSWKSAAVIEAVSSDFHHILEKVQ